ncbi:uncharacterized protein LOC122948335 [Acropora millepora]|uniref:uncharacterized protein LOC122948335 n=1 Tax=Acropora millepora TaxID=45264 RepID=UPI001CF449D3|nr:uncharacterized protein LOC122948335 [Acropora millepora]
MSALGGSRAGSGRKRLYSSKNSYNEIWRRGYRRIWIDNMIYSSWVSAELKCGYSTDSNFTAHLLFLERGEGETTQLLRLQPRRERRTWQMTLLRSVNAILKMRYVFPMLSHRLQCNLVLLLWIYQWGELPVRVNQMLM